MRTQQYSAAPPTEARRNPFSPPAYGGVPTRDVDYQPMDFTPVADIVLTANQVLINQVVTIENDADFDWRATIIPVNTGAFKIRFYDAQFFALSNDYLNSANFKQNNAPLPWVVSPSILIPAGGVIQFDIADLSGSTNTIQINFRGVKLYKLQ